MKITAQAGKTLGVTVEGLTVGQASAADIAALKKAIYTNKIAVLKGQTLTPSGFLAFGELLGGRAEYTRPRHYLPGRFWHSDYQLTPNPFDLAMTYPKSVTAQFIDMGGAYERLSTGLKSAVRGATATHSVLRHASLGPEDVRHPITELVELVNDKAPPVVGPAATRHPHTGETVLHVSAGFTLAIADADGTDRPDLLAALLEATGQLDPTDRHENIHLQTFEKGDLLVWDTRSLIHRASRQVTPAPAVSVYDASSGSDGHLHV
jgi:alpha-ketoglutarate-dependent taurine dioxygenase